jgi:hypothetical protein
LVFLCFSYPLVSTPVLFWVFFLLPSASHDPAKSLFCFLHTSLYLRFFIRSFSSWFILILQNPSSFCTGPKIFLSILRSNILSYCSSRFVNAIRTLLLICSESQHDYNPIVSKQVAVWILYKVVFVFLVLQPTVVVLLQPSSGLFSLLILAVSRSHTTTHHSR